MSRAVVLQLFHEANAFSPLRVTREDFLIRHHMRGEEVRAAFGATHNWMGGVLSALEKAGVETEIGLCTAALPGGPLDPQSWQELSGELLGSLDSILARGPVDHIFLLLHGALAVDGVEEPEGDLAQAVRARIGEKVHLAVPLDFHANVGPKLVAAANLVLGGKLYPHTDTRDRGARLVELALSHPELKTHHFPLGIQVPMPRQVTTEGPFAELAALTNRLEQRLGAADITLLGGFPFSTAPYAQASALVTAADVSVVDSVRSELGVAIAAHRRALTAPVAGPADAVEELRAKLPGGRCVIVDIGDNPGGGGLGDRTHLLPHLEALGRAYAFGALVRPQLVQEAEAAGEGGSVEIPLPDGHLIARVSRLQYVRYRNAGAMMRGEELDGGPGAVLETEHGEILVTTHRIQAYDTMAFASMGIDLEAAEVVAIKSIGHFRASYTPLAKGGIILVDSGGYSSPDCRGPGPRP